MGVIDIDAAVRGWAERHFQTINKHGKNVGAGNVTMDIDWSKVHFSTARTTFSENLQSQRGHAASPSQVVFNSTYDNRTEEVQNHTFMMERTTEATVKTKVTSGFSKSGAVGINIAVPELVAKATGGFGSEVHILSEDENTVKQTMTWSLNSTVKAQPNKRTLASLVIKETEHKCNFDASVNIQGRVLVKIMNGESQQVMENNIATILEDGIENGTFNGHSNVIIQGRKVTWKVSGNLSFKFGISQDVKVWSEPIIDWAVPRDSSFLGFEGQ